MNSPLNFRSTLVLCVMKSFCKWLICAKMNKFPSFVTANSFSAFSSCRKGFGALQPFLWPKLQKTRKVGELVLIMLVSKEVVAAGAWVSRSPTSCTQNLFPKS